MNNATLQRKTLTDLATNIVCFFGRWPFVFDTESPVLIGVRFNNVQPSTAKELYDLIQKDWETMIMFAEFVHDGRVLDPNHVEFRHFCEPTTITEDELTSGGGSGGVGGVGGGGIFENRVLVEFTLPHVKGASKDNINVFFSDDNISKLNEGGWKYVYIDLLCGGAVPGAGGGSGGRTTVPNQVPKHDSYDKIDACGFTAILPAAGNKLHIVYSNIWVRIVLHVLFGATVDDALIDSMYISAKDLSMYNDGNSKGEDDVYGRNALKDKINLHRVAKYFAPSPSRFSMRRSQPFSISFSTSLSTSGFARFKNEEFLSFKSFFQRYFHEIDANSVYGGLVPGSGGLTRVHFFIGEIDCLLLFQDDYFCKLLLERSYTLFYFIALKSRQTGYKYAAARQLLLHRLANFFDMRKASSSNSDDNRPFSSLGCHFVWKLLWLNDVDIFKHRLLRNLMTLLTEA